MKVFGMFYGGSSYGLPDAFNREDVESFRTIQEAEYEMESRVHDSYYPCVEAIPPKDGGMYMYLYRETPFGQADFLPEWILEFTKWSTLKRIKV